MLPKINGLYDIQPPGAAELSNTEWGLIILVIAIFLSLFFYLVWKKFYSKRNRIKREIIKLQRSFLLTSSSSHKTVYLICDFLRYGLGLSRLTRNTPLPGKINAQQSRWTDFTTKLDQHRYQKSSVSTEDLDYLFSESLFWLRTWP